MRLIDADALLRDIEHYHLSDGKFQHWVEIQPTIEERKTGKWICSDDLYETAICSCCGWDTAEPYGLHIRNWFMYCPNCGARMVQEGEEHDKG